jgi:hypothetical protein
LVDGPGQLWDIEGRLISVAEVILGESADSIVTDMETILESGLRVYLRRRFFRDHLSQYTQSRRKAPIYWPLYLPSGRWGVWVYAPAFTRETLYAVTNAAAERLDAAELEVGRLQRERAAGGVGRSAREVVHALEIEEQLAGELRRFRQEADRIAGLGWEPDLDDGIILCAAPLAGIFPAWRDATVARDEIREG